MNTEELVQNSAEWKAARAGSVGASQIADVCAKTKTGYGASRANLMAQLIAERLTGMATDGYTNAAMQWGTETEPEARAAYEFWGDVEVVEVGLVRHPTIGGTHASPDGLVGGDGLLEVKCPQTSTHIDTLLGGSVPGKYVQQAQWQMACTGRAWVDWVSYDPRMPDPLRLFVRRIERDAAEIERLEGEVVAFLKELNAKLLALSALMAPQKQPENLLLAG